MSTNIETASLPQKRRVGIQIAPQAASQQERLGIGDQAPWQLFLQIRVGQLLPFPFLPMFQKTSPPCIIEEDCTILPKLELRFSNDAVID